MKTIKHIGRIKNTGAKVLVAFRTLPGESNVALVLPVATLTDAYHDALMQLVESDQAQDAFEFGEIMHIRPFPDGRPMLRAMQADGRLQKVATDNVIMTPAVNTAIPLDQLNLLIAEQKNCTVDELCNFVAGGPGKDGKKAEVKEIASVKDMPADKGPTLAQASNNEPLSDQELARSFRSQADALYKEAAKLRKQADDLDPPAKKASKSKETVSAETAV